MKDDLLERTILKREQERKKYIHHVRAAGSVYLCACLHLKSKFNDPIILPNDTTGLPMGALDSWDCSSMPILQVHYCMATLNVKCIDLKQFKGAFLEFR